MKSAGVLRPNSSTARLFSEVAQYGLVLNGWIHHYNIIISDYLSQASVVKGSYNLLAEIPSIGSVFPM